MYNKLAFYLNNVMKMATVSKTRVILTSAGIFIAVFAFSAGTIFAESYYAGFFNIVDEMDERTAVVKASVTKNMLKSSIATFSDAVPCDIVESNSQRQIFSADIGEGQYLSVFARLYGVSAMNEVIFERTEGGLIATSTKILRGRPISSQDTILASRVAVIDEITANLLFPEGDAVGKKIQFGILESSSDSPIDFTVIGVIKNPYSSYMKEIMMRRELVSKTETNISLQISLYCPVTAAVDILPVDESNLYTAYSLSNDESFTAFKTSLYILSQIAQRRGEQYIIVTKQSEKSRIDQNLVYTKNILGAVTISLSCISGISIMSVTFFAVKERIREIGLRKAFGAAKSDIVFQFLCEIVAISFIASILAVCCALCVGKLFEGYLTSKLYIPFKVSISLVQFIHPIVTGILVAALCSVIPSLYAASVSVTDALRFD